MSIGAYGLLGENLVWLIGAVVCLLAANHAFNCSLTRVIDSRIVRCGLICSCQSAATSEIVERFRSRVLSHVKIATTTNGLYFSPLSQWNMSQIT